MLYTIDYFVLPHSYSSYFIELSCPAHYTLHTVHGICAMMMVYVIFLCMVLYDLLHMLCTYLQDKAWNDRITKLATASTVCVMYRL